MIQVEGLSAGYGRTPVLHNIDFSVERGSVVALLGRNGVGKTTLLKALIGEVHATRGTVRVAGKDVTRLRTHQRSRLGVAYVPQGRQIFSDLSVLDNLRVTAYAAHKAGWQAMLKDVLAEFPILTEKQLQPGGSLSGGQQQILALGRALMTQPDVLLLDEPSEGIQPSIVQQIGAVITDINRRRGITVVLVEQNLEFASMAAHDAYVMDKGEIVRELRTADLLADKGMQHELLGV